MTALVRSNRPRQLHQPETGRAALGESQSDTIQVFDAIGIHEILAVASCAAKAARLPERIVAPVVGVGRPAQDDDDDPRRSHGQKFVASRIGCWRDSQFAKR